VTAYAGYEAILAAGNPRLYTAFVLAGGMAGGFLIRNDAKAWALDATSRVLVFMTAITGGLAGAALPAFYAGEFVGWQARAYDVGPKTILGGLLFSFFSVALFKRLSGIRYDTSDAFARGTCLMMAVGRLGCVAGHCCFGVPWAHGVDAGDRIPRVPVQLLEAAALFALYVVLERLHRGNRYTGRRLFIFFTSYGILRFLLEFLREPVARSVLGLGFYQWLALALAATGVFQLYIRRER
jgi:prolipoprotein diacylglyceryltransferase